MQTRLECMLAVSSRWLSRTKSSCCGLPGYHHLAWTDVVAKSPWPLDGVPKPGLQGKNQLSSMKSPAFVSSTDPSRRLLPILKNKLKASYRNLIQEKGLFFNDHRLGMCPVRWDLLQKYCQNIRCYSEIPKGAYYGSWNPTTSRRKAFLKFFRYLLCQEPSKQNTLFICQNCQFIPHPITVASIC